MQVAKVNMDNHRFYLPARIQNFESAELDFSSLVHSSGAPIGPEDGDLDGCTYNDGDSDDDATFFFHTCLGCGLVFGVVDSLFSICPSSLFFGS